MWHSTIFGPYFVAGAIFSGIAALILVMAIIRKVLHLEVYLTRHHFDHLAKLLLLMSLLWFYFTHRREPDGLVRQRAQGNGRLRRPYARALRAVFLDHDVPELRGPVRAARHPPPAHHRRRHRGIRLGADRHVDRALRDRRADAGEPAAARRHPAFYTPTWVEVAITAATFAAMVMLYMIFAKLFPIIAVWEFKPHPQEDN